jgi:hypothetical protein
MKKILVAILASSMMLSSAAYAGPSPSPTPPAASHRVVFAMWAIFGCSAGIVLAALAKNYWRHTQLTATEAATCGMAYWVAPQPPIQDINTLVTGSRIKF